MINQIIYNTEVLKSNLCNYSNADILLKTQNYMSLSLLYQQRTTKNYQNFSAKNLKDQCTGIRIKQNEKEKYYK